ncbi:MAG: phage tail tape measure protein [Caulobacter sp.]
MTDLDPGGLDALPQKAAEAGAALEALREPARRAADSIDEAFARAGESLSRSLGRAAADGELSLAELAQAVLAAVNAAAGQGGGGLSDVVAAVLKGGFAGARAGGGPVTTGGAYLVGERGPEVFRPAGAGTVEPVGGGGMTIHVTVEGGGAEGLARSDAQIAQALARAVGLGARRR